VGPGDKQGGNAANEKILKEFAAFKDLILERSHLNKEKLCITIEHLENPQNLKDSRSEQEGVKVSAEAQHQIKDLVAKYAIFFPKANQPAQNTDEEIDRAANEYF
jgi:hypothetical protein